VHDYGFYQRGSYSINAAHANTSVRYDSIRRRVIVLEGVSWYIKADLKSGYRQFGTHPSDWRFQVYCNGAEEHYIDIACPFGKTNSSLEFCPPVKLFAMSVAEHWSERSSYQRPRLSSYVDDIYGGIPDCASFEAALSLRNFLCDKGEELTFVFNRKPNKTPMPARQQVILGCLYDSTTRKMRSSANKVKKYVARIDKALRGDTVTAQEIMSLHGNLVFAANVAPFGRPFLAPLSSLVAGRRKGDAIKLTALARLSLGV